MDRRQPPARGGKYATIVGKIPSESHRVVLPEEEVQRFDRDFYLAEEGGAQDEGGNPFLGDEEKVRKHEEQIERVKKSAGIMRQNTKQTQLSQV